MKASETRGLNPDQLNDRLAELKREQFNLRVQQATGQLENPSRRRQVRRDIARIKTILGEKSAPKASA